MDKKEYDEIFGDRLPLWVPVGLVVSTVAVIFVTVLLLIYI